MYQQAYSAQGGAARTMYKLSEVLNQQRDFEAADKMNLRAEELMEKLTGSREKIPDTASAYDNLVPYMDR